MSRHTCHAIGCTAPCPPRHLMCQRHWLMVSEQTRAAVCAAYTPGQERRRAPITRAWLAAAVRARAEVAEAEGLACADAQHRAADAYQAMADAGASGWVL